MVLLDDVCLSCMVLFEKLGLVCLSIMQCLLCSWNKSRFRVIVFFTFTICICIFHMFYVIFIKKFMYAFILNHSN